MAFPLVFKDSAPSKQLLMLLGFFLMALGVFSILSIVALFPFVGAEVLSNPMILNDYTNPHVLNGLKVAQIITALGSFILPAWLFNKMATETPLTNLGLKSFSSFKIFLFAGLAILSALPLINILAEWNNTWPLPDVLIQMEQNAMAMEEAFLKDQSLNDLCLNLVMFALVAGFAEEFFFRGALQPLVIKLTNNKHAGIWITAILFSALHMQFLGFVPRVLMGAVLGYIYQWSGSLWVSAFTHFTNNACAVLLTYLVQKGIVSESIDTIGTQSSDTLWVILSIVFTTLFMFLLFKNKKHTVDYA